MDKFLSLVKKQTVGTWITLGAFVLTLVSAIIYGVHVGGAGYFQGNAVGVTVAFTVLSLIAEAAIIVLAQFEFEGIWGTVVKVALDVLKIVLAFILMLALIPFLTSRLEGLAYILFCDENLRPVLQTAENMSSVGSAVTGFVFYIITWLAAVVAAFFTAGIRRTENQ